MTQASGNERGHALYAPSAAHRWMVCAASAKHNAMVKSLSSAYAAEGTVAHHVLEEAIKAAAVSAVAWVGDIIDVEIEGKDSSLIVTKEMADAVQVALDFIWPIIEEAETYEAEQQVSLKLFGMPDCYGTSDFTAVVRVAGRVIVADYKHGAGVVVEVKDNPQLKIYALGTLLKLGKAMSGITHIQTTIIQPRIPHGDGPIRSHTYTIAELMDFGYDVLAAIERCEAPNPEYVPGEHCHWCAIDGKCAAQAKANANIITVVKDLEDGMVLSPSDQERLLQEIESLGIEDFITSLRASLHRYVEEGGTLEKYKLVPKRPSRVWLKDESQTVNALTPLLGKKKAAVTDLYNMDLKTPAQIEKVIGKGVEARTVLAGLTASVSSGTNLVSIDDPRRAAAVSAEDEFDALTPDD